MTSLERSTRALWPQEKLPNGVCEYKCVERGEGEWTAYFVGTVYGLLLGKVYSRVSFVGGRLRWFAVGWTPRTSGKTFGPFGARWQAMECLLDIENGGELPVTSEEATDAR